MIRKTYTKSEAAVNDIEWKDATSYRQGEHGKIAPTAWECTIGEYRIWVGSSHVHHPRVWLMTCHPLGIKQKDIGKVGEIGANTAQCLALSIFSEQVKRGAAQLTAAAARADAALIKMGHDHD